jgi:hypothetical protein
VHDLIENLNDLLGPAYDMHQRHGLLIEQLFEPHVRFFVAGLAVLRWAAAASRCSTITPK